MSEMRRSSYPESSGSDKRKVPLRQRAHSHSRCDLTGVPHCDVRLCLKTSMLVFQCTEKEGTCRAQGQQTDHVMPGKDWHAVHIDYWCKYIGIDTGAQVVTSIIKNAVTGSRGRVWSPVKLLVHMLMHRAM